MGKLTSSIKQNYLSYKDNYWPLFLYSFFCLIFILNSPFQIYTNPIESMEIKSIITIVFQISIIVVTFICGYYILSFKVYKHFDYIREIAKKDKTTSPQNITEKEGYQNRYVLKSKYFMIFLTLFIIMHTYSRSVNAAFSGFNSNVKIDDVLKVVSLLMYLILMIIHIVSKMSEKERKRERKSKKYYSLITVIEEKGKLLKINLIETKLFNNKIKIPSIAMHFSVVRLIVPLILGIDIVVMLFFHKKLQMTIDAQSKYQIFKIITFSLYPLSLSYILLWIALYWDKIISIVKNVFGKVWFITFICVFYIFALLQPQCQDIIKSIKESEIKILIFCIAVAVHLIVMVVDYFIQFYVSQMEHDDEEMALQTILPYVLIETFFIGIFCALKIFSVTVTYTLASVVAIATLVGFYIPFFMNYLKMNLEERMNTLSFKVLTFLPFLIFGKENCLNREANSFLDAKIAKIIIISVLTLGAVINTLLLCCEENIIWIGSVTIFLISCTIWMNVGSTIALIHNIGKERKSREKLTGEKITTEWDLLGNTLLLPIILLLLVCFSYWRNNHEIRIIDQNKLNKQTYVHPKNRESIKKLTEKYRDKQNTSKNKAFIITVEGGGLRSAYWSAKLLSSITDKFKHHGFKERIFAISSVSGGTLGSNVYCAVANMNNTIANIQTDVGEILGNDFLSPVIAKALFSEIIQRFVPFNIPKFSKLSDRAAALEKSWEKAFKDVTNSNKLEHGLLSYSKDNELPALFLNCTVAETGCRGILSTVKLDKMYFEGLDLLELIGADLPWSTSISLSARFPIVSPGGRIRSNKRVLGHLVDGGYHDNSGILTACEIANIIEENNVKPHFIVIRNEYTGKKKENPIMMYNEILEPIQGLWNVRNARGKAESELLKKGHYKGRVFEFNMNLSEDVVPMGWFLSDDAKKSVDAYIEKIIDGISEDTINNASIYSLDSVLISWNMDTQKGG